MEDQSLVVEIDDNGIGRKRSQELKTANQKRNESTGMKNTESRILLLNKTYRSNIAFVIEDLDPGTKVKIHIPFSLIDAPLS